MSDNNQIEIELSKQKILLLLIGSILFVGLGIWFVINPDKFISSFIKSATVIFIAGIAAILFFGFVSFFIFKKLFDKKPGLTVNNEYIIDNSSAVAAGQIFWSDVLKIKISQVYRQEFLMLIVSNPEEYINKQSSSIKRKAMQMNFRSYGSPISISANGLQCSFDELKNILEIKFAEFKTNKQIV